MMSTRRRTVPKQATSGSFKSSNKFSSVANGGFAFVKVNVNGRVTNKKHLHTIRKHIMKDIGQARRKGPASQHDVKRKEKRFRNA